MSSGRFFGCVMTATVTTISDSKPRTTRFQAEQSPFHLLCSRARNAPDSHSGRSLHSGAIAPSKQAGRDPASLHDAPQADTPRPVDHPRLFPRACPPSSMRVPFCADHAIPSARTASRSSHCHRPPEAENSPALSPRTPLGVGYSRPWHWPIFITEFPRPHLQGRNTRALDQSLELRDLK
jgi:hypothetical protein